MKIIDKALYFIIMLLLTTAGKAKRMNKMVNPTREFEKMKLKMYAIE